MWTITRRLPLSFFARPLLDMLGGLDRCGARGARQLLLALAGLVAGWWIYVPIHELLHAAACVLAGGSVTKLEISGLYGGGALARLFPFVVSGGEYAGRLSGFDTHGSDLTYLATDCGPYLLTLFPGVWLLRVGGSAGRGLAFGLALPMALAPFLSLTGDAYEIGSIVATRLPAWSAPQLRELLRGDDLFRILPRVAGTGARPILGVACGTLLGATWAWSTYLAGAAIAGLLGRGPVGPTEKSS